MSVSVYRPNSFAYPGNRLPGFDPTHPAALGTVRCSAICIPGVYINVMTGLAGTNTSMTTVMDGIIGPALTAGATGSVASFASILPSTSDSQVTMAAIFRMGSSVSGFSAAAASNLSAHNGAGWFLGKSGTGVLEFGTSAAKTAIQSVANTSYFYAASGIIGTIVNWAVSNLQTGQIYSGTAGTPGTLPGGGRTSFDIGTFATGAGEEWNGPIATAMFSTAFLSVSQLAAWAADPWGFWFPRSLANQIFDSLAAQSAVTFRAAWALGKNVVVEGVAT